MSHADSAGQAAAGPFCSSCGARLSGRFCSNCGQPATAPVGAGPAAGGAPAPRAGLLKAVPGIVGGGLVIVVIALILRSPQSAPAPAAGPSQPSGPPSQGALPDLSKMTPRERFNRLYGRVITAAQQGDQKTVEQFTPMAIAAFGMLDTVDPDARYHLAMIQLHIGDAAAAQAQADTLMKTAPDHLFGYVIAAAVARWTKDDAKRQAAHQQFVRRYPAESKSNKPEYLEHGAMLAEVFKAAQAK